MRASIRRYSTDRAQTATPAPDSRTLLSGTVLLSKPRSTKRKRAPELDSAIEETNIRVVVRCRGRNEREVRENSGVVVLTEGVKGTKVQLSIATGTLSSKTY